MAGSRISIQDPNKTLLSLFVATGTCMAVGAVFLFAAAAKAWDPSAFARTVAFLLGQGSSVDAMSMTLTYALIMFEAMLGGSLLLFWRPRIMLAIAGVTLLIYIFVLAVLLGSPGAPSCNCLGLATLESDAVRTARLGIVRNVLLLVVVGWTHRALRRDPAPERMIARTAGLGSRPGLTLIESLVSIAVLAVVIGLIVPTLALSRDRARMLASLATHKQLLSAVFMYASDHDDALPYLNADRSGGQYGGVDFNGFSLGNNYFTNQAWHWTSVVVPDYFASRAAVELPHQQEYLVETLGWPSNIVRTRFWMTYTAFAAPALWTDTYNDFEQRRRLLRGMQLSEVRYPSQKGLLLDIGVGALVRAMRERGQAGLSAGFADGSSREINWYTTDPDLVIQPPGVQLFFAGPIMATRDGFHGRDLTH